MVAGNSVLTPGNSMVCGIGDGGRLSSGVGGRQPMMCVWGTRKGAKDLTGGVAAKELQEGEGVKQWNWGGGERRKAEQGKCGIGDLRKVEQWMWAAGDCWMAEQRK